MLPMTQRLYNVMVLEYDMKGLKTECPKGHPYKGKEFFIDAQGTKRCKICIRENNKKRYWNNIEESREYNRINHAKWRKENHEHVLEIERRSDKKRYDQKLEYAREWFPGYLDELQKEVLTYYGNGKLACVCCGEDLSQIFLTIDHVNGDGAKERKQSNRRKGWMLKQYLRSVYKATGNWPKGYQTLCWNCNCGRGANNGICPHKEIKQ